MPRCSSMGKTLEWCVTALLPGRCGIVAILTGLARNHEAVTLAQQNAHPFSLGFALSCAAGSISSAARWRAVQERAEAVLSLATEQGFPLWVALGVSCVAGRWRTRDRRRKGSRRSRKAYEPCKPQEQRQHGPYYLAFLAEAHSVIGPTRGRAQGAWGSTDARGYHWRTFL